MLADFAERDLIKLFNGKPLKEYTRNTIQSVRSLAKACEAIRAQGFATDQAEYAEGVCCIAAPIRNRDVVIASIGISAPAARFPRDREKAYAKRVVDIAMQIGQTVSSLET